jgi:membrane associated rhomboid family serine protease
MELPPPPLPRCTRHSDRETGRLCTRCANPYCSDCLEQAAVGSICVDCRRAAAPSTRERLTFWNAGQPILVTKILIALNVAIYLWVLAGDFKYATRTGIGPRAADIALFGPLVHDGEWYRIVSSGFLHFGLLHIGMNMFLLFQLGNILETGMGRGRFLLIYVASLFGGAAGALIVDPRIASGGASGAVFGLMATAVIALKLRGVNPWRTGLGMTLVINLVITFAIPGISKGGHIGGMIAGFICGWAIYAPGAAMSKWRWNISREQAKVASVLIPIAVTGIAFALCLAGAAQSI